MFTKLIGLAVFALGTVSAQAGEVYGGVGFPGLTLGYSQPIAANLGLRGEYTGGLNVSKSGQRSGVNFDGKLKAQSASALVDYFPSSSAFRVTGGVNFNDTKFALSSVGGMATINGKAVSLAGEFYNVEVKQPSVTPYLGLGYGFKPEPKQGGWSFYADAGVMFGKFRTTTNTSLVGKQGITQADIDAQTATVSDSVAKLSVLPKVSVGVSYRF
ncbi:MAG: hypothetical protein NVS2B4_00840 [Ramlibacter sp.]